MTNKRKKPSSTIYTPPNSERFEARAATEYFLKHEKKGITPQRGLDFFDSETAPLEEKIVQRGWEQLAQHKEHYCPVAVQEFYANLFALLQKRKKQNVKEAVASVRVRKTSVPFSPEAIRTALSIPDIPVDQRNIHSDEPSQDDIATALNIENKWAPASRGTAQVYPSTQLPPLLNALNWFVHRSLAPSQQEFTIRWSKCLILYKFHCDFYIDAPSIIYQSICDVTSRDNYNWAFPQLITQMIEDAGVDMAAFESRSVTVGPISVKNIKTMGSARSHTQRSPPQEQPTPAPVDEITENAEQIAHMDQEQAEALLFAHGPRNTKEMPGAMARLMIKMASFTETLSCKVDAVVASNEAFQQGMIELRAAVARLEEQGNSRSPRPSTGTETGGNSPVDM